MINTQATANEPLKFFEDFFLSGGFQKFYDDFYDDLPNQERGYEIAESNALFGYIIVYAPPNDKGVRPQYVVTYIDELERKLEYEFLISRRLLLDAILEHISKFNDADRKITFWLTNVQDMYSQNVEMFKEYPECIRHLNKLVDFLNARLTNSIKMPLFEIPIIKQTLIKTIFSFLQTNNILSNEAFGKLLHILRIFVIDFSQPKIKDEDLISINKKHKPIVRYCFFVLYDQLTDSRGHREDFVLFLKNVFIDFKNDSTLKSHFSDQLSTVKTWYPEIINKEIEKSILMKPKK